MARSAVSVLPERLRKARKADAEISGALLYGLIEPDINRVKDPGVWLQPSARGGGGVRTRVRFFVGLIVVITSLASACGGPHILSNYGSLTAVTGQCCRAQPHNGVDFAGGFKDPVLAAAGGRVVRAGTMGPRCGVGVSIRHAFGLNSVYCHFSTVAVEPGTTVTRGQPIGTIGVSGDYGGVTHVHLMLGANGEHDPTQYMLGCFEPGVEYPSDKIVLTYPVECRNR